MGAEWSQAQRRKSAYVYSMSLHPVLQPAVYSARNRLLYLKVKNIAVSSFQIMMTIIYNKPLVAGFYRKGKCVICCGHVTQV